MELNCTNGESQKYKERIVGTELHQWRGENNFAEQGENSLEFCTLRFCFLLLHIWTHYNILLLHIWTHCTFGLWRHLDIGHTTFGKVRGHMHILAHLDFGGILTSHLDTFYCCTFGHIAHLDFGGILTLDIPHLEKYEDVPHLE